MTKMHPAQKVLDNAKTVMLGGDRPGLQRRSMALLGSAALVAAMALAPQPAAAQNYSNLLRGESTSANQYGRDEALRTTQGRLAEVVMVRPVEIRNNNRVTFGAAVGGAVGVGAANEVSGNRTTRNVARALLGGLGAAGGQAIQKRVTAQDGYEITVLERGNKLTTVVQSADLRVNPGDFVMLSGRGSKVRVVPLDPQFQSRLRGEQAYSQPAPSQYRPGR